MVCTNFEILKKCVWTSRFEWAVIRLDFGLGAPGL